MQYAKLRRTGNSLVITIPKEEVENLGLTEGDIVAHIARKAVVRPVLSHELAEIADHVRGVATLPCATSPTTRPSGYHRWMRFDI